jgi:hypothetical protein
VVLWLIVQVVQVLLDRGADPTAQDRAGTTALSLVRTLSRPPKEVVQTLVDAESAAIRSTAGLLLPSKVLCCTGLLISCCCCCICQR